MNLRHTMYKLQTALLQKGVRVKINQYQVWSEKSKRMVTKYVLSIMRIVNEKEKYVPILESYQIPYVVKKLAEMYRGESNGN